MISKGVILIVDDEETIRFSIKEFLEGQGMRFMLQKLVSRHWRR